MFQLVRGETAGFIFENDRRGVKNSYMEILLYGALRLSQLGTGAKQYAMKKCGAAAPGAFNSICINLIRTAICLVVSLVIWAVMDGHTTNSQGLAIAVAAGVGTAFSLFTWILSAQRISLTLLEGVCTIGSLILPLVVAPYLYGGESVSPIQWLGTAFVMLSLLLFSEKRGRGSVKASMGGSIVILTVCCLGTMVAAIAKKMYTFHITAQGLGSVELFTLLSFLSALPVFAILLPIYYRAECRRAAGAGGETVSFPFRRVRWYVLVAAVALYVTELFATYASDLPSAVYYPATKALNILGCFVLDSIVFKEKITARKAVGLVLLLVAVILINL